MEKLGANAKFEGLRYSRTQFPHGPGPSKAILVAFNAYDVVREIEENGLDDVEAIREILAEEFEKSPATDAFIAVLKAALEATQNK